jgi:4-amino-4-deoxy-L-arabinose transferase-like glycosyltransferase
VTPTRTKRILALTFAVAFALRLGAYLAWDRDRDLQAIETGNIVPVLALASGKGLLRPTAGAVRNSDPSGREISPLAFAEARDAEGGRVDAEHPYPADARGWIPDTLHVFGYSLFLYALYVVFGYGGMLVAAHGVQILLDSTVPLLLYGLGTNLFSRRVGLHAAWIYALLPPPIFLIFTLTAHSVMPFFEALILWLASDGYRGRPGRYLLAGAAMGIAALVRADFLLLPLLFVPILWASTRSLGRGLGWSAAMGFLALAIYAPWIQYASRAAGRLVVTTTTGAGLYQQLGLLSDNPWGVVLDDNWIGADAQARGFEGGPWSPEADLFYGDRYRQALREHPLYVARLILLHRLPFAIVPPYLVRDPTTRPEFRFTELRQETGLSNWGIVRAYPGAFVATMWPEILVLGLSGGLALNLLLVLYWKRSEWRILSWLVVPWAYHVASIALIKYVEPQNMAPLLVVQSVALGMTTAEVLPARRAHGARFDGRDRGPVLP